MLAMSWSWLISTPQRLARAARRRTGRSSVRRRRAGRRLIGRFAAAPRTPTSRRPGAPTVPTAAATREVRELVGGQDADGAGRDDLAAELGDVACPWRRARRARQPARPARRQYWAAKKATQKPGQVSATMTRRSPRLMPAPIRRRAKLARPARGDRDRAGRPSERPRASKKLSPVSPLGGIVERVAEAGEAAAAKRQGGIAGRRRRLGRAGRVRRERAAITLQSAGIAVGCDGI